MKLAFKVSRLQTIYSQTEVQPHYRRRPNLAANVRKSSIHIKAAVAVLNASITGSQHGIFGTLLSGREVTFYRFTDTTTTGPHDLRETETVVIVSSFPSIPTITSLCEFFDEHTAHRRDLDEMMEQGSTNK